MKCFLSPAITDSTTLIPKDRATKNQSVKKRIPEMQKSEGLKEGKKPLKPSSSLASLKLSFSDRFA